MYWDKWELSSTIIRLQPWVPQQGSKIYKHGSPAVWRAMLVYLAFGDYYYVMLFNTATQRTTILMNVEGEECSLPYFEYPEIRLNGSVIPRVCEEFKSWLGIVTDDVSFTGCVELLGGPHKDSRLTPEDSGRANLLLVEAHGVEPGHIDLPKDAEWNPAEFVPTVFSESNGALERIVKGAILRCMDRSSCFTESLLDERYRPCWSDSASRFLVELAPNQSAEIKDHVMQHHMSSTSTMLPLNSSLGSFFLKSPAKGCNETSITAMIAELFPTVSPTITGISKTLNCFVSREFEHEESAEIKEAILALGKLQLASVDHIEPLAEACCPVRDMGKVGEAANE